MLSRLLSKPLLLPKQLVISFLIFFIAAASAHARQVKPAAGTKPAFTARLMNIEAAANEVFRYNAVLQNGPGSSKIYELKAELPAGWMVTYRVEGSQVTSLNLEPGKVQDISIEINATAGADPGKYKIPARAISSADTLVLNLEAVVKGSYGLALSTPTGRLSDEVTSGSQKEIKLVVKNSGTLPLNDLELSSQLPSNWEASFEPSKIGQLEAGKTTEVSATVRVPDKTIAGDYAATFKVSNASSTAQAEFRMMVKTSLLSGWIGVLVILAAIGVVYYLIRKYGRR